MVKKSGLHYLYHGHPFTDWGHFNLIPEQFPNGWAGMKKCVQQAEKAGIYTGTHVLSNFITTNDAYVTPVPDKRLAKAGSTSTVSYTHLDVYKRQLLNSFRDHIITPGL